VSRLSVRRWTYGAALLMAAAMAGLDRVESAEPQRPIPVHQVSLFHRAGSTWSPETANAPAQYGCLEYGDIPQAPWDRTGRIFYLCDRWHARHEEKKAWHYYIRGVGPAVHERSPGRPCLW
jgi:hypothetical protein